MIKPSKKTPPSDVALTKKLKYEQYARRSECFLPFLVHFLHMNLTCVPSVNSIKIITPKRDMIITHHREKLINAIIYFAKCTNYCGKTKLLKLLYFLDFMHFKQTGKSVTGLDYFAWDKGPVPKELFEEISGNMAPDMSKAICPLQGERFLKVIPKKEFDSKYFSNREIRILEELAFIFKDAKADDMVESTHLFNEPWDRTRKEKGRLQKIDYMLAIDSDTASLSYEQAKDRMAELAEIHEVFGVR